jgi:sugar/nucleoside kinase (ribokinase family)
VGVIGTFVWDVIHGPDASDAPVESWGGITYAMSGLAVALPDDWEIVPVIKVGADLAGEADRFLGTLRRVAADAALVVVPERNNRCELRYYSRDERTERLTGGVPAWTWPELAPALESARLDALYVNFLSGWELDLDTASRLRTRVRGPIYCDLHMAAWAVEPSGMRALRPFTDPAGWCRSFDYLQVNEDEMRMLAPDAQRFGELAIGNGVRCAMVTLGRRGVRWFSATGTGVIAPEEIREGRGIDPTGCGDVWGATMFARILAGDLHEDAMRAANRLAGHNAKFRGTTGLAASLARVDYGQTR